MRMAIACAALAMVVCMACGCTGSGRTRDEQTTVEGRLEITTTSCEYMVNPLGIDTKRPRLSWAMRSVVRGQRQTAYQILVASNPQRLQAGEADLWDSGKVTSGESIQIDYGGPELTSGQRCYWKVRVWDRDGKPMPWSEPAWWEMGLLSGEDWKGKWINDGRRAPADEAEMYKDDPAPLFRKQFSLSKRISRARLYISGLGLYEARINGKPVGDRMLDPGWTSYGKRALYSTFDVTEQLRRGTNCIGVMLGNGWYNPLPMRMWGRLNLRKHLTIGRPRFIAQIEIDFADGTRQTVASDETWRTAPGPILRNNLYLGEVYDARREVPGWDQPGSDDSLWRAAAVATEPIGPLQAQMQPPIRAYERLSPVRVTELRPGVFIADMGQNFAGTVFVRARGAAGTTVRLRYGELLNPDGTLNVLTSTCGQIKPPEIKPDAVAPELQWDPSATFGPGAPQLACQEDTWILRGEEDETYSPRFTFHGYRYVEITAEPLMPRIEEIYGIAVGADAQQAGSFECSNPLFNRIQQNVLWTFRSNLFSVQSDCPHREKFGYGGDIVPTCDALLLNFDMAAFYAKVVNDFADAARQSGAVTETAPFVGVGDQGLDASAGPIGWMLGYPLLQAKLYQYAGDRRVIEEQYEATKRLVEFIRARAPEGIVEKCISDHESLDPKPVALTATAHYYHHAQLMARFAKILGKKEDQRGYEELSQRIKAAFIGKFLKPGTGRFDIGTQACQAFALAYDLVPQNEREAAFDALIDEVVNRHKGHLATGIFGTRLLLDVLSQNGRADLAYTIASQESFPGWGHMIRNGATTLWETWAFSDNTYSHNHPMFGSISAWFYESVAGIRPHPDAYGFDRIMIRPNPAGDLRTAGAANHSIRGMIISQWRVDSRQILWLGVSIPPNTTAAVYVPTADAGAISEGDRAAGQAPGVRFIRMENGAAVFEIESGTYQFKSPLRRGPVR